ncbi:MAG TPA: amino acid permease, partial [Longimicrobiaceae bacterium]|nr:amino acid permease [Longimicrobiaceae bacterium]
VVCGLVLADAPADAAAPVPERTTAAAALTSFGAAMIPVMFAFGGWQTASFVAGEMRDPRRDLARGLVAGVLGVVVLYLAVNVACLYALGPAGLAETTAPASAVMRLALGERGAALIAVGITVSTLGFLSQGMLTAPRVYFAMAADGVFFRRVAWVHPRTRAPVVAIALQGVLTVVIALSGTFEQILNYVVSVDFIFFGLTAGTVFVFRRRDRGPEDAGPRVPGHPVTTALFIAACAGIVASTVHEYPANSAIGLAIMLAGIPVYFFWSARKR